MHAGAARTFARRLTAATAVGLLAAAPPPATPSATDVLARVNANDARLESYSVPVRIGVRIHRLFTVHLTLNGTQYFKRPSRLALDIRSVPAQYRKLFSDLGTPLTWPVAYDLHLASEPNAPVTIEGVPKRACEVQRMTLAVADDPGAPLRARWTLRDGSTIDMQMTEGNTGGYELPRHADVDLVAGGYAIHASIDYGTYVVNEAVADSVFAS